MIGAGISSACSGTTTDAGRTPGLILVSLLSLVFGSAAATDAVAQSPGRVELTPWLGYGYGGTFEDEDAGVSIELDDASGYGVIGNLAASGNTQWEAIYARQSTAADTAGIEGLAASTDIDVDYLQLGGTYLGPGELARPYLAATIGGTRFAPQAGGLDSDTYLSFSLGAGLSVSPDTRLGLRLEVRAFGTLVESDSQLFCVSAPEIAGCAIRLDGRVLWQLHTFAGIVFRF